MIDWIIAGIGFGIGREIASFAIGLGIAVILLAIFAIALDMVETRHFRVDRLNTVTDIDSRRKIWRHELVTCSLCLQEQISVHPAFMRVVTCLHCQQLTCFVDPCNCEECRRAQGWN